jgi:mannosyl-3-phosphoglycerate phosphatase
MMITPKLMIFTDLDGTLLNRNTYSFEPAQPALAMIRQEGIPLILVSSKTRAEIESYRRRLKNSHPFISENGGAVFIPEGYFSFPFHYDRVLKGYQILELGTFHPQILKVLESVKEETGILIRGFSDLAEKELVSLCGLSPKEAELAKKREYDEPFVIEGGEKEVEMVKRKIEGKGMNYIWGGRFHHILGHNDKGKAVKILKELYTKEFSSVITIALGDSLNDWPMFSVVDHPIFLKGGEEGSSPKAESPIQNLTMVHGAGPRAWNEAILGKLNELRA